MTSTRNPDITVTADSLRALFTALNAELYPPDPDTSQPGAVEAWHDEQSSRRAGVAAELQMLADACSSPSFGLTVEQVTALSVRDADLVGYPVKGAKA